MGRLYQENEYIQNSIASSRLLHESINTIKGTSNYELFSVFINDNIKEIDRLAEIAGNFILEKSTKASYEKQYSENTIIGKVKRNMSSRDKVLENERKRRNEAFAKSLITELVLKYGARGLQYWLNEKSKYDTMYQVYSILCCMANEGLDNANVKKMSIELAKIRNSLPLSLQDKRRLLQLHEKTQSLDLLETPVLFKEGNQDIVEAVSYLLYALSSQKYDDEKIKEAELLVYYDYLGFQGKYAQEILRENRNTYNQISKDQVQYLKVARGMVNNLSTCVPSIDAQAIAQRAVQMAQYDPYCITRRKSEEIVRKPKTIADLYFENPELVMNAGTVALSQFNLDDNEKDSIMEHMRTWSIDDKDTEAMMDNSEYISDKAKSFT